MLHKVVDAQNKNQITVRGFMVDGYGSFHKDSPTSTKNLSIGTSNRCAKKTKPLKAYNKPSKTTKSVTPKVVTCPKSKNGSFPNIKKLKKSKKLS